VSIELVDQLKYNGMKDPNVKMVKDKVQNIRRTVGKERINSNHLNDLVIFMYNCGKFKIMKNTF
jgi:hypothetical protein